MTKQEFEQMLDSLANAWKQRDYATAAGFFAEDVYYNDPIRYSFSSKDKLQSFFENDEGYAQNTVWHTVIFDEEQQAGAAEYTYDGTHRYHGTVLIRLKEDRIINWREYQHIDSREWEEFKSMIS